MYRHAIVFVYFEDSVIRNLPLIVDHILKLILQSTTSGPSRRFYDIFVLVFLAQGAVPLLVPHAWFPVLLIAFKNISRPIIDITCRLISLATFPAATALKAHGEAMQIVCLGRQLQMVVILPNGVVLVEDLLVHHRVTDVLREVDFGLFYPFDIVMLNFVE